jgi:hypothetical protein
MSTVTYLFGAGASSNCLPTVKGIPNRLRDFAEWFVQHRDNSEDQKYPFENCPCTIREVEEEIITECRDLADKSGSHASMDTYAKKLTITETKRPQIKYIKLKVILSLYFIHEQLKTQADPRYDSFFASILGTSHSDLNGGIRIITWNYDFQFEKAFSAYSTNHSLQFNQLVLKVFPSLNNGVLPSIGFSILKINGTTAFKDGNKVISPIEDFAQTDFFQRARVFTKFYAQCVYDPERFKPLLSFAWENGDLNKDYFKAAQKNASQSDALVVIGYSFPFFNRKVDRFFLSSFSNKKIYIQDLDPKKVLRNLRSVIRLEGDINQVELFEINSEYSDQFFYLRNYNSMMFVITPPPLPTPACKLFSSVCNVPDIQVGMTYWANNKIVVIHIQVNQRYFNNRKQALIPLFLMNVPSGLQVLRRSVFHGKKYIQASYLKK